MVISSCNIPSMHKSEQDTTSDQQKHIVSKLNIERSVLAYWNLHIASSENLIAGLHLYLMI